MKQFFFMFFSCAIASVANFTASAETKIIEADSTYIIGDNDSKIDARRIATQEAKRKALELAGTYVESLTVVKNYQLSRDEIQSYTAGMLETEIVSEQMRGTVDRPEVYIKTRCTIDTTLLQNQIAGFRENEDLKEQLDASAKENDELRKERDALVAQLKAEKDKTKAAETRQKIGTILAKEESNEETNKVWINIGPQLAQNDTEARPIRQADLDSSTVILQKAVRVNPQNQRARSLLASLYQKKGDMSAAENELRTALGRNPSSIDLRMKLGILLQEQGRYPSALREFHAVERLRPQNPLMLFHTGMTFRQMGQCNRSVQYLNRFLLNPRVQAFPQKKRTAAQAVEDCGMNQPGYPQKIRDTRTNHTHE